MPQDDNIEDLDSSAGPVLDDKAAPETQAEPTAKSSTATSGDTDDGLLSVVRDVVKESRKEATAAASPAEGEETGLDDDGKKKAALEDYSDVPFNKHPRFQQLLRETKTFRQDAERYHGVIGFLEEKGLSSEEAADGLQIMALAKSDPASAWKAMKPWVEKILVAAGEILPEDLRTRVSAGEMNQQTALELSRARAMSESSRSAQTFQERLSESRQQRGMVNELRGAATAWETDRRLKDPSFDAKYEAIQKEVSWLIRREGQPRNADGVRDQLRRAYKAVNDQHKPAPVQPTQQRRPPITPVRGGHVAGSQNPKEMSTLEIVRANRRTG